ncbi:sigma-70 domain-containing protein [Anaerostipes sp. MSJ-23]|uniref:sigma-70 domain-containing protein n=1 Tax=Anaerostipes sp. MSJ-23 TaxID=2841520 RepID=UPI001C0FB5DE|nr:sigma-70 domain-containing protein [Anaerostipes sp. MSJ-23]MBU5460281.1 RNA polymerase subunit sigma-70 [Anaerostipes sp. MSJ-23]
MDKSAFLKGMEEMLSIAKTNGNQISKEELLDYFSDLSLDESAQKLLFDTYEEAGIRVIGYEKTKKEMEETSVAETKSESLEEDSSIVQFYEEELQDLSISVEEQQEVLKKWLAKRTDGDQVIQCLLPLVVEIAREHQGKGVLFADLIQEGNIGLLEAMASFSGDDKDAFMRHAKGIIEDCMLDAIAVQKGSDNIGQQIAIKANRLDEASTHLAKELGREPKAEELAEYLSMTVEEIKEIMKVSLDAISVMEADITPSNS